jgi:ATP-dependent Zn proteases
MISEQYARAKKILFENKEGHNQLAQQLIDKEVIFAEDVEHIFGKRPWTSRSEEIISSAKASENSSSGKEEANASADNDTPEVESTQAEEAKKENKTVQTPEKSESKE